MAKVRLTCPRCGEPIEFPATQACLDALEVARATIRAKMLVLEDEESAPPAKPGDMGSIWDRRSKGYAPPLRSASPARSSSPKEDEGVFARPPRDTAADVAASWGFGKRAEKPKESDENPFAAIAKQSDKKPTSSSLKRVEVKANRETSDEKKVEATPKAEKVEPKPEAKPSKTEPESKAKPKSTGESKSNAKPESKRDLEPSTLLAALAAHPKLNPGQRATVEMIYNRFAPKAAKAEKAPERLLAALEADPNLNKGQMETLRTVVERFDK